MEAASRGFNVVLAARRKKELTLLANQLRRSHGVEARAVVVDLSKADGAERLHRETSKIDHVELVVANAGFSTEGRFIDARVEVLQQMMMVTGAVEREREFAAFKEKEITEKQDANERKRLSTNLRGQDGA